MLRRLFLTVLGLLTLNLSASGTLRACEKHRAAEIASTEMEGHHHHGRQATAVSSGASIGDSARCAAPASGDCCTALSSCGSGLGLSRAAALLARMDASSVIRPTVDNVASALLIPPDPPPPKALA
jgi:hypothetical protein